MPISPIDFLHSAQKEIAQKEEIHSRNAISRAYYSAYHSALVLDEVIPDHGGIVANAGVHEKFLTKLTNCLPAVLDGNQEVTLKIKSLGYVLKQAKTARFKADYQLESDVQQEEAEAQIELVKKIFDKISEVESLLSSHKVVA